jgi:hypothetical protein
MRLKIFIQPNCPKCPAAKKLGKKIERLSTLGVTEGLSGSGLGKLKVEFYDTSTVDGLAEGAFYQVMSAPTVLLTDDGGKVVGEWRGIVPKEKEIFSKLKAPRPRLGEAEGGQSVKRKTIPTLSRISDRVSMVSTRRESSDLG